MHKKRNADIYQELSAPLLDYLKMIDYDMENPHTSYKDTEFQNR